MWQKGREERCLVKAPDLSCLLVCIRFNGIWYNKKAVLFLEKYKKTDRMGTSRMLGVLRVRWLLIRNMLLYIE